MAFDPATHGVGTSHPYHPQAAVPCPPQVFQPRSDPNSAARLAKLKATLNQLLGPEYISQRPGPGSGNRKLSYLEGWKAINLANEIFGFDGWASSITSLTVDYIDHNSDKQTYSIGVTAVIRVVLRDGMFHEDVGYGTVENVKQKGAALDKCKKEAVTDGVKRALRNFGNVLGNCLYDQSLANEILKVPVPRIPRVVKSNLYRRPEFAEKNPNEETPKESTILAAPNNQIPASSDAQHASHAPANNAPHPPKPSPPATAATSSRRPEPKTASAPNQSLPAPRPQTNPSLPAKPRSSANSSNRTSSISRHAAIEAAMAEPPKDPDPPAVPPQPPSPVVRDLDLSRSSTSFGSDDDMLYVDIDLNLECYEDTTLAGDLTLVNGPAPVTPDDPTVQPRQGPSRYEPLIQERPPSSNKEPKSAFDPLHSRSSGSTSPTAVNGHPRNVFNSATVTKPSSSRPAMQEFAQRRKRNSDEMNELARRTTPILGGFTTAVQRLPPAQFGAEGHAFPPQNLAAIDDGNGSKRTRR